MPDLKQLIARHLPYLRRYSRALTGSQGSGDNLVRAVLKAIVDGRAKVDPAGNVKVQLYATAHRIADSQGEPDDLPEATGGVRIQERLGRLPALSRRALLLISLEGFSRGDAAAVLDISPGALDELVAAAQDELRTLASTKVLVIEDEPVIALHISEIVKDAGHDVVGIATSKDEAVRLATETVPGLILCDIQLDDGSTGIEAAQEILKALDVPIIFVTAYPERLLTGERMEPTYLVSKPFEPETLTVTMAQALFHHPGGGLR